MKKLVICLLIIVVVACSAFVLVACGEKADYKVGISQALDHPSLDEARRGFTEELERLMKEKGKTVNFEYKNANDDKSTNDAIANTLTGKKKDLLLGISTNSAQALQGKTTKTPILFTAVTDPVGARLVGSDTDPLLNANVTGTSDAGDSTKIVELIKKLLPGKTNIKLGILYTITEINSQVQFAEMKKTAMADSEVAFTVEESTINALSDVEAAMRKLDNCDLIYIPTDNKLASAMANVQVSNTANRPIVTGAVEMIEKGGVASLGTKYFDLGKQTAQMAFDILYNGKKTTEMVYQKAKDLTYVINEANATSIGFTIPQAVKDLIAAQTAK